MAEQINTERLATLMAAFENGEVFRPNPFDVEDPLEFGTSKAAQMCAAFAKLAYDDTPRPEREVEGLASTPTETETARHEIALVVAGLLQGMWIGYEYAHRDVYGDES